MGVFFTSDWHLGHKNIQKFRKHVQDEEHNRKLIIQEYKDKITKRDDVYVLGDAVFTMWALQNLEGLPGRRFLIRGNHDKLDTQAYLKHFHGVYGLLKYKEFWLSHAPIHPQELRGKVSLHGHVHYETVRTDTQDIDMRYFNCCVENLQALFNSNFIELETLRKHLSDRLT